MSASCTVTVFSQPEVTEFTVKDMGGYYAADLTAADIPGGATVWIGAYSGGNYLLTAEEVTLSDGAAHAEIHTSGATMFKVFVWDENTMEPITESVEVNL